MSTKDYLEQYQKSVARILECTCQLFYKKSASRFQASGSGIIFRFGDSVYLISAAHALRDAEQMSFQKSGYFVAIQGKRAVQLPFDGLDVDIGAIELSSPHEGILNKTQPAAMSDIELDHVPLYVDAPQYAASAYPASKTEDNPIGREIKKRSAYTLRTAVVSTSLGLGHKENKFIFLISKYDRADVKHLDGTPIQQGPMPIGMSGGGLWFVRAEETTNGIELKPRLVGILIEFPKGKDVMVSTRIDLVTELIRKNFDPSVPKSPLASRVRTEEQRHG